MSVSVLTGDCRDVLVGLPAGEFHTCVTSPPYFGLRDYGHEGQIGLEPTPDEFVAALVAVFREVRRVLRDDGTCWINLGDSYNSHDPGGHRDGEFLNPGGRQSEASKGARNKAGTHVPGMKRKDLIGIPWMVAFALRADGWVLRQEIIWAKPNPMPESVRDRCTKAHESLFLFAKAKWTGPADSGRFAHISDEDARWLALCIDTEGCIVVKRCKHEGRSDTFAPQVSFGSTSEALIERFREIVGYGNLARRPGINREMIYWQVGNNIARDFLHRIHPFLIVKQRQARIGIYVDDLVYKRGGRTPSQKQRTAAEDALLISLWERNKALNNFGDPDISDVPAPVYGRWVEPHRYYFDAKAISEAAEMKPQRRGVVAGKGNPDRAAGEPKCRLVRDEPAVDGDGTRNRRSVWTVASQPFSGAHFATFPPDLIKPCILAGCPVGGHVLDPFGGAGTTGLVADRHQRNATLIELNPAYAALARSRIHADAPLFMGAAE